MIRLALIVGTILSMGLTGCCPITSLHPLGQPKEAVFDGRIIGTWYGGSSENDSAFIHIGKGVGNQTQVLAVEHKKDGQLEQVCFPVSVSRIQGQFYMNIDLQQLKLKEVEGHTGYVLVRYHMPDADTLVFSEMDEQKLANAISNSKVAGEITYEAEPPSQKGEKPTQKKIDCVRLTDTTENLHKFLSSKDAKDIFVPYMTLKRIKP